MKAYLVHFTTEKEVSNGYAIIAAETPSQACQVLRVQGKYKEVQYNILLVTLLSEMCDCNGLKVILEGIVTPGGMSAYDIAVKYGYEGTEYEWNLEYQKAVQAAKDASEEALNSSRQTLEVIQEAHDTIEESKEATGQALRDAAAAIEVAQTAAEDIEAAKQDILEAKNQATELLEQSTSLAESLQGSLDQVEGAVNDANTAATNANAALENAENLIDQMSQVTEEAEAATSAAIAAAEKALLARATAEIMTMQQYSDLLAAGEIDYQTLYLIVKSDGSLYKLYIGPNLIVVKKSDNQVGFAYSFPIKF